MQEVIRTHTQAHTDAHTCAVSVSVHYCYEYQARVNASGKWKHENGVIYNDLSPCVLLWVHTNAFNKPPWRNLITVCILARLYLWDVLRRVTGRFCLKISRGHVRAEGGREGGRKRNDEEKVFFPGCYTDGRGWKRERGEIGKRQKGTTVTTWDEWWKRIRGANGQFKKES